MIAAEGEAERASAIAAFRATRERLWQIARECYLKTSLPPWPFRTPAEIRGCARRGLSSRQRMRLENAVQAFTRAYTEAIAFEWNPLNDQCLTERKRSGARQCILPLEIVP